MSLRLLIVFVLISICMLCFTAARAASPNVGYLFVLQGMNSPFNPAMLDKSFVDGIALQVGWREVEPTQGDYDWRRVDQIVGEAQRRGKRVTLHLLPLHPPEWVFTTGAQKYCFTMPARGDFMQGRELCEPLPWDPVFLDHWSRLVAEFGKHFNGNRSVLAVSVTAPSPEMVLGGAIPRSATFFDLEKRYNKATYLNAWKKMVDVYQRSFPDKVKFLAPGIVLFDEYFADEVVVYARDRFGANLWLFNAGLRADGIPQKSMGKGHIAHILESYANKGVLGLQTIWSATNDPNNRMRGSLRDALTQGLRMGASYFEVYAVDVQNSSLQSDLEDFKRRISATR